MKYAFETLFELETLHFWPPLEGTVHTWDNQSLFCSWLEHNKYNHHCIQSAVLDIVFHVAVWCIS